MQTIRWALAGAALAVSVGAITAAHAATLIGLTADGQIVQIDTTAMTASAPRAIAGASQRIVGIDRRPADGKLYGLAADGAIVTIDPATGAATAVSKLSQAVELGGRPIVDFNPAADRLRVIAKGGVSLRIAVETGATTVDKPLVFDQSEGNTGKMPSVVAGAYTNSVTGAKATELLHIEMLSESLVLQAPPNDGILKQRGKLGLKPSASTTMDIWSDAEGRNTAFMIADRVLYTVDLAKGAATRVGEIKGLGANLVDVAAMTK
jgi:hypothetical protein